MYVSGYRLRRSFVNRAVHLAVPLAALSLAILSGRAAHAQQVIANGITQTASGTIDTGTSAGPNGYALHALNGGTINSSGSLTLITGDASAHGAYATSNGQITIGDDSTVTASGSGAGGAYATGGGQITIGDGSTVETTTSGQGLYAHGTGTTIAATNTTILTAMGQGVNSVHATNSGVITLTGGSVIDTGSPSNGTALFAYQNARITASGVVISISKGNGYGAHANQNGIVDLTNGSVTTAGDNGHGLYTLGANSSLTADGTTIETSGAGARGAFAQGNGGEMTLRNVSITTTGDSTMYGAAHGASVDAYTAGTTTSMTITNSSVKTTGALAFGLHSTVQGSLLTANNVDIYTERHIGATAQLGAKLILNGGTVTTIGDSSAGLFSVGLSGTTGASITADGVTVTTSGANSHGASVRGGSSLAIQNSSITAAGTGSAALYSSVYDANPSTATIANSTLESAQAAGIYTNGTTLNATLTGSSLAGGAALLQTVNSGTLNLTADASTLTGAAQTETSSPSSNSSLMLQNGTLWAVTGDSNVTTLGNNASTIRFTGATPVGITLKVEGNYTGNNGKLEIRTVLGDDSSTTDKLVVTGNVTGVTTVTVTNSGGPGALTTNGIRIIEDDGSSAANAFALASPGSVSAGGFTYTLEQRGDGWYLVSQKSGPTPGASQPIPALPLPALALLGGLMIAAGGYMRRRRSAAAVR